MMEIRALNPDAVAAELVYRRQQLMGNRIANAAPHGRWRRRRNPVND